MTGFLARTKEQFAEEEYLVIKKAYMLAKEAHKNQLRDDKKDFFSHVLNVARLLEHLKADYETIAAGLLHDTVEDTTITMDDIKSNFNEHITYLVDATTHIDQHEDKELNKQKTREKILSMGEKDNRVFLIKIVDRLHNLRTCKVFEKERKLRFAQETLEFYVPLAEKLKLEEMKIELEKRALSLLKE
jgi:GTP diphosphokinase / guanosine-3',5'-bis(diphosphate) 3'-diphosphatase